MKTTLPLMLAGLLIASRTQTANTPQQTTLKAAYTDAFLLGPAVNDQIVPGADAASQAIVPVQFNTITADNVMKNEVIQPQPGIFDFGPADAFVEFGEQNQRFIVGHTLVWHNQTPAWFF